MTLDRVTMTGADDSIGSPDALIPLTREFPFVEWGILVSASSTGSPRFPSMEWLRELKAVADREKMDLSLHVCGRWVRDLLKGRLTIPGELTNGPWFQRIQLNFHAERTECDPTAFHLALSTFKRQYIFQIDGAHGNKHLEAVYAENAVTVVDAVPLFDISGGAGILPSEWPKPYYMRNDVDPCYHGYAGGLGPENLEQQIPLIADAAGGCRIWIDMETRVRSADDRLFDLDKVRRCLEIAAPHVTTAGVVG